MSHGSTWRIATAVALVLAADQISKSWAVGWLDERVVEVVWTLRLRLVYNTGVAFSLGRGLGPLLSLVAVVVVAVLWRWRTRLAGRWAPLGLGAVIGGAAGNLIDRLLRGRRWGSGGVVDFIDLQWWPVFNVADASIVVGLVGVVTFLYRQERRAAARGEPAGLPECPP